MYQRWRSKPSTFLTSFLEPNPPVIMTAHPLELYSQLITGLELLTTYFEVVLIHSCRTHVHTNISCCIYLFLLFLADLWIPGLIP